jgi:RNA polymerase sigma-70 factor, ECF subfamily
MTQVESARASNAEFARETEGFRRELLAHCYRLVGSVDDAEDAVQETYLRAWRSFGGFEGRSSVRTWLYRIATNVCLSALQHRSRRMLPSGLGGPGEDPDVAPAVAGAAVSWLQPIPDALLDPAGGDPADIVAARDRLRLALVASLQYLPPRQRAVLILRDVLAFPAAEVAEMLGTTTDAVKSVLRRARTRLDEVASDAERAAEPTEDDQRRLLEGYIAAFESGDAASLGRLLVRDAVLEFPPSTTWFAGKETCVRFLAAQAIGAPGDWRMVPSEANGQPAAVAYLRGDDGRHHAFGVAVLTVTSGGIARIAAFGDPGLVARFGHPLVHEG